MGMHMPSMQIPQMPSMSIPSMPSMPRGLSPSGWGMPRMNSSASTAAAATRSVSTGGEPRSPKSPSLFARIVRQEVRGEDFDEDEEGEDDDDDDGSEDDDDEDMVDEDDDEEDVGVGGRPMDDLELFGHR